MVNVIQGALARQRGQDPPLAEAALEEVRLDNETMDVFVAYRWGMRNSTLVEAFEYQKPVPVPALTNRRRRISALKAAFILAAGQNAPLAARWFLDEILLPVEGFHDFQSIHMPWERALVAAARNAAVDSAAYLLARAGFGLNEHSLMEALYWAGDDRKWSDVNYAVGIYILSLPETRWDEHAPLMQMITDHANDPGGDFRISRQLRDAFPHRYQHPSFPADYGGDMGMFEGAATSHDIAYMEWLIRQPDSTVDATHAFRILEAATYTGINNKLAPFAVAELNLTIPGAIALLPADEKTARLEAAMVHAAKIGRVDILALLAGTDDQGGPAADIALLSARGLHVRSQPYQFNNMWLSPIEAMHWAAEAEAKPASITKALADSLDMIDPLYKTPSVRGWLMDKGANFLDLGQGGGGLGIVHLDETANHYISDALLYLAPADTERDPEWIQTRDNEITSAAGLGQINTLMWLHAHGPPVLPALIQAALVPARFGHQFVTAVWLTNLPVWQHANGQAELVAALARAVIHEYKEQIGEAETEAYAMHLYHRVTGEHIGDEGWSGAPVTRETVINQFRAAVQAEYLQQAEQIDYDEGHSSLDSSEHDDGEAPHGEADNGGGGIDEGGPAPAPGMEMADLGACARSACVKRAKGSCSHCGAVAYCSGTCMQSDWHAVDCSAKPAKKQSRSSRARGSAARR